MALMDDISRRYQQRGVQVYSPNRALVRPTGTVANAGTAGRIGMPNGPVTPSYGGRVPSFGAPSAGQGGNRSALESLYAQQPSQPQQGGGGILGRIVNNPISQGLQGALNVLDVPRRAVISTLQETADAINGGDADWGDWWDQVQDPSFGFGDVVGNATGNRWVNRVIGLTGDILLDPLTYVAGSSVLSGTGRSSRLIGASQAISKGVEREVGETLGKFGYSRLDDAARAVLRDTAGDTIRDAGYYFKFPFVGDYHKIPGTGYLDRTIGSAFGTLRYGMAQIRPVSRFGFWRSQEGLEAAVAKILTGRGDMPLHEAADLITLNRAERLATRNYVGALEAQTTMLSKTHKNDELTRQVVENEMDGGTQAHAFFSFAADKAEEAGIKFPDGRRANHIPHYYTERGRGWLTGADPDAVTVRNVFAIPNTLDDTSVSLLPRQFTKGTYTYKGKEFTLHTGSITEINKVGRDVFGLDFDLLETDFSTLSARYSKAMAETVGIVSAGIALTRSKSGRILRAGDHAATKEVVDEVMTKYASEIVADQMAGEIDMLSGAAQKFRADTLEGVDDIRGVLGVHAREVINELHSVSIRQKQLIEDTMNELSTMRAERYYTPEQQAATGATNKLEEVLHTTLRELDTEIDTTEAGIARVQRQALIERQAYDEAIRQGRLERRINNIPERFKALREWNALMLKKAHQGRDHEIVSALRERARQAGLKADIIDRNLENDSFLNLAAGDQVPSWLSARPGTQRVLGPDGRPFDIPLEGQPAGASFVVSDTGTAFRVTDVDYWGEVSDEASLRGRFAGRRAELLSSGEGDAEQRAVAAQVASKHLEVAEAQRRLNHVLEQQQPAIDAGRAELKVLRTQERALTERIDEASGWPHMLEEHDALLEERRILRSEQGELGQAEIRYREVNRPVVEARSTVKFREKELTALKRKQENLARERVGAQATREQLQTKLDQATARRQRIEAELAQVSPSAAVPPPSPEIPRLEGQVATARTKLETARARLAKEGEAASRRGEQGRLRKAVAAAKEELEAARAALREGTRRGGPGRLELDRAVNDAEARVRGLLNQLAAAGEAAAPTKVRQRLEAAVAKARADLAAVTRQLDELRPTRLAADPRHAGLARELADATDQQQMLRQQLENFVEVDPATELERRINTINAEEERAVAEARKRQTAGTRAEYTPVPSMPARQLVGPGREYARGGARAIDQPRVEGIGRVGMYGPDDRGVLEHAYTVVRNARREGTASITNNAVYREAMTQIRQIEAGVAAGVPLSALAGDLPPREMIQQNIDAIERARTPMAWPKEGEPGYAATQGAVGGIETRGGDTTRIGSAKEALAVSRTLNERIGKDLIDLQAMLPGDVADVQGLTTKMDDLLAEYQRYPAPQLLDMIDNVKADLLRWSDVMNRQWAAMEDGLQPSEGLGALIVRHVLQKERTGIDNDIARYSAIAELDPQGIIDYNARIDVFDRKVRAADTVIEAEDEFFRRHGRYKNPENRRRAMNRRRENARKLAALQAEGPPDAGLLSDYVQGLVKYWGDQVEFVDEAVGAYNNARHVTRDMNWVETKKAELMATTPRLEGEMEVFAASNRRLDRAIKVAEGRGSDTVRYTPWREEEAVLSVEEATALLERMHPHFRPALQRKIDAARTAGAAARQAVEAPPLTVKILIPGTRSRVRRLGAGYLRTPQELELTLQQAERSLNADALLARGVITSGEADELRSMIPEQAREMVRRNVESARAQRKLYAEKFEAAQRKGMVVWKMPTNKAGVVELPIDVARDHLAANAKAAVHNKITLENKKIQLAVINGTAKQEIELVGEHINDQVLVRNAAQETPNPKMVAEQAQAVKKLQRNKRDLERYVTRQKRERTALENERLDNINLRLERLQGDPLASEEYAALISRRERLNKAVADHEEQLNGNLTYIEAGYDDAEKFLYRLTTGEKSSAPGRGEVRYDEAGLPIVADVEVTPYSIGVHDVEVLKRFLGAEGGEVGATWINEINEFLAQRGEFVTQSELNQLVDRMHETFGDTEMGRRIQNAILDEIAQQGEANADLMGIAVRGAGVEAGAEMMIKPEVIRRELYNSLTSAAKSLMQQRQRDFGQMWDQMGFQFTTIPGLENKLLASGKLLPGKYEIKGRRILDENQDEVGRLLSSGSESKMGALGYQMSTQTWDRKTAAKFILDQFRIQMNYTPDNAIKERLATLGMRKQRINTMLRGLGGVTTFPRLNNPERFFLWLDGIDKFIGKENPEFLQRMAREFESHIEPLPEEQLLRLEEHIDELREDFQRAVDDNNEPLAAQIMARIDTLEEGRRPTTAIPQPEQPIPTTETADNLSEQRRTMEVERVNATQAVDAAKARVAELQATEAGVHDTFDDIIRETTGKPAGEFSRADILNYQYNVLNPFERANTHNIPEADWAPGIAEEYERLINQMTDMNAARWEEEALESPETYARAQALDAKHAQAESDAGFMHAHEVDMGDDLAERRTVAQRQLEDAQERLATAERQLDNLGQDGEPSMLDEASAAEIAEGGTGEHIEAQPSDMAQPGELNDPDEMDLSYEEIDQEYEDVTSELSELVARFDSTQPFDNEAAAQAAHDRMYELLARARRLEGMRRPDTSDLYQAKALAESPRYREMLNTIAELRQRKVRYSWHDVMRGGTISSWIRPKVAGGIQGPRSKLGASILSMAGTPAGRGWTRNSLAARERPWLAARVAIDETKERLGTVSQLAREEQERLLGQAAGVEHDTARLAELEPQVAVAADVSDIAAAAERAHDLRFAEHRRLVVQRQRAQAAKLREVNEYQHALAQTDALIGHTTNALSAAQTDFRKVMHRITTFERGINQMPAADAKEWTPMLLDLHKINQEMGKLPDADQVAIDSTRRLIGDAFDAQREVIRLETEATDVEAILSKRLKQFEQGAYLVSPIMMRDIADGWTPIMAKAMTGHDLHWVEKLEDGTEIRHLNRDAVVMADSLASAWNLVRNATTRPETWKMVDRYTAFFKTYATMKPGFHVRNALSAVFMNLVDGVKMRHLGQAPLAWRAMSKDPERYLADVAAKQVLNADTKTTMADAFAIVWGSGAGGQFQEFGVGGVATVGAKGYQRLMNNALTRWNRRTGSYVEGTARLAMAMDGLAKGMSVEAALERVIKFHFDYTSMSRVDRTMRRFIPFWTFMSRNLPLQIEQMFLRPRVYQMYRAVVRNFGQPLDPATPEYWLSQGVWTIDEDAQNREAPWYFAPDLPHLRVTEPLDAMARGEWGKALFSDLNPLGLAPIEAFAINQKMYTGAPLTENYREPTAAMRGLMPLFNLLGGTKTGGTSGKELLDDRYAHVARSLLPPLDFIERLTDTSGTRAGRQDETLLRAVGFPVLQLTPELRESTQKREYYQTRDQYETQAQLAGS